MLETVAARDGARCIRWARGVFTGDTSWVRDARAHALARTGHPPLVASGDTPLGALIAILAVRPRAVIEEAPAWVADACSTVAS